MTSVVTPTSRNPPLAIPLTFAGTIRFENAIDLAQAAGLAPATVDHGFGNAYMQSWNFNVQRELSTGASRDGRLLWIQGLAPHPQAQHQPAVAGVRPYPAVSAVERHSAGHAARQYHSGGRHGQLELQRSVGLGHETTRARAAGERVLHLVEIARL